MFGATFTWLRLPKWRQCLVRNAFNKNRFFFCFFFGQNAQNFVYFGPYNFVQISPARGPNTYQIMYAETLDFE